MRKADENTPLVKSPILDDLESLEIKDVGSSTFTSAAYNLFATAVGAGAMTLPYTIFVSGIVFGYTGLTFTCLLTLASMTVLVDLSPYGGYDYMEMSRHFLGLPGLLIAQITMLMLLIGASMMFVVISMDLLFPFFGAYLSVGILRLIIVVVIAIISIPRTLHGLRHLSAIAIVCLFSIAIMVAYHAVMKLCGRETPTINPTTLRDDESLRNSVAKGVAYALPMQALAYAAHVNVPRVYSELTPQAKPRMKQILMATMLAAWLFYVVLITCHMYYMDGIVGDDLLRDYSTSDVAMNISRLLLSLVLILKGPLVMQPLISLIESVCAQCLQCCGVVVNTESPTSFLARLCLILVCSSITYLGCVLVPQPGKQINMIGSTTGVIIAFIIPGSLLWSHSRSPKSSIKSMYEKVLSALLIVAGIVMGVMGLISSLT